MKELLAKIQSVYDSLVAKEAEASRVLADVLVRESAIKKREERNSAYESADAVLTEVSKVRSGILQAKDELENKKAELDNKTREELQKIEAERARLAPLQDAEKQLFKDRQALSDRETALEADKQTFKSRYIEKIKLHFKNTQGAPSLDDIT
jgi:hypothetical protein